MRSVPLLPWERLLWSGRSRAFRGRYFLTDFRLVRLDRRGVHEIALQDIGDVRRHRSRFDRLTGASTIVVRSRRGRATLTLDSIGRGEQLAALLEVLSGELRRPVDAAGVEAALSWQPQAARGAVPTIGAFVGPVLVIVAIYSIAVALHGTARTPVYSADDALAPNGEKRSRAEIVGFMQRSVMPWARAALGSIEGGPDRVSCETCHGPHASARDWKMPAVAALPMPDVRDRGWEHYGGPMDAQMRNAIYGYIAEPEKQPRAAYMREVIMPGMARLLHRPAYDFTKPYDENRARLAFGCYHCHMVK